MCTNIPPPFHLLLYQSTSNSAAQARKHSPVSQQWHYLLRAKGYSAITQNSKEQTKRNEVLCHLWTMSETDVKKLSNLLENISAPFLKKLIWKI